MERHRVILTTCDSPGSTVGEATPEESMSLIAQAINRAHQETNSVTVVLENMVNHAPFPFFSHLYHRWTIFAGWFRKYHWFYICPARDYYQGCYGQGPCRHLFRYL